VYHFSLLNSDKRGRDHHTSLGKDIRVQSAQEVVPERLLLRVPEAAERLGIGRTKMYEMIASGELPAIHIGRAVRISASALQKWVEEREQQSDVSA
jgi:excisionase family DNA binding protein